MSEEDILRYDLMVERALRAVVRDALKIAAGDGLPGDHHFYITFRTDTPGVEISEALRTRYPEEMTIVVQHQFWDLAVADDYFAVTLSFSGRPERLVVPYESISAFADPAVRFGLQFDSLFTADDSEDEEMEDEGAAFPGPDQLQDLKQEGADEEAEAEAKPEKKKGDDNKVVTLDSFRKK
jgi:hypothetical protein